MKTRLLSVSIFLLSILSVSTVFAQRERSYDVGVFSEISLRVPATVYLTQSDDQSVRVVAKESTFDDLIVEVKGNELIFRFPAKNIFQRGNDYGKIQIYVSAPQISGLSISGSGDIVAESLKSRILDLAISGSGDIDIDNLSSLKVKSSISGSGDIKIRGKEVADELTIATSGSGDFTGSNFEAKSIKISMAGSGDCRVKSNGHIKINIAGSGDVYYNGNPSIDSSVAGSGNVRKM